MLFKYQAPSTYKSTVIVISGTSHAVKNGLVESDQDIYFALQPMGFTRHTDEHKKAVAVSIAKS